MGNLRASATIIVLRVPARLSAVRAVPPCQCALLLKQQKAPGELDHAAAEDPGSRPPIDQKITRRLRGLALAPVPVGWPIRLVAFAHRWRGLAAISWTTEVGAALSEVRMNPMKLLVASAIFGSWAFSTIAAPLSPEDAAGHIGETATVCGVVAWGMPAQHSRQKSTLAPASRGISISGCSGSGGPLPSGCLGSVTRKSSLTVSTH
jgi:hypothetical protein